MPNGRPGDNWVDDVVEHHLPTFAPDIDDMMRRVAASRGADVLWAAKDEMMEADAALRRLRVAVRALMLSSEQ
jgi:hypothetical protein